MYKIAYIDESKSDRYDFQDYVKYAPSSADFLLAVLEPLPNAKEFAHFLIESHYQAIIIDFDLKEKNPTIHYDGAELAEEIFNIRDSFPIFILTSFEEAAFLKSDDVNIVYDKKSIVHKEDHFFLERVKQQIRKFEKRIQDAENRLLQLIDLGNKGPLSINEEDELIQLDNFIEKTLNKKMPIPDRFKSLTNDARLDRIIGLLERVDTIIEKANIKK